MRSGVGFQEMDVAQVFFKYFDQRQPSIRPSIDAYTICLSDDAEARFGNQPILDI
jgi:hypothetical protein